MFDAKLQALRDAYPKFSTPQVLRENWDAASDSPASSMTPLMQKSCPPKQTNRALFEQDPSVGLKKALFKASRKSMGTALNMTWEDDE